MKVKKSIVSNFISRVCFVGSALLVNVFFSRLLGASGSGDLYFFINNLSIVALFASMSLESGITYFISRNEIDDGGLVGFVFIWTFFAGLVAVCLLLALGDTVLPAGLSRPVYPIVFIAGTLLTTYFSAFFFARQQFIIPFIVPAATNLILVAYCWQAQRSFEKPELDALPVKLFFSAYLVNGVALAVLYRVRHSFSFSLPARQHLQKLFSYSLLAFVANLVSFLAYRIDYWVLKAFMPVVITANDLGNYIQVARLVQVFLFAPTVVATVVFPVSSAGNAVHFGREVRRMILGLILLNAGLCIVLAFFGRMLFPFVFGQSFLSMYNCFLCSIPAIMALTIVRVMAAYFAGNNLIKYNLAGGFIALVIVLGLNFLLVPLFGINGAAIADGAGYTGFMLFLIFSFQRINRT